jgi:CDP-glucose 4,6-dehydratase
MEGLGIVSAFWQDRPILVTGATGLLGGWLVRQLLEFKSDLVCLVRDWVPQSEFIRSRLMDRVKIVRGDVRDQALLERILGEYEISTVFHLAAQTIVGIANRNPISTFETNIQGTWALLEAARHSPMTKQIIIASSDKAYGNQAQLPYDEKTPLQGNHPYDVSKSCADLLAQAYAVTYHLPVVITRCGNFYGGGDLNWNRLVPGTIRSILHWQRPVIRSNGKMIRDYIYIQDAVDAYVSLAEQLATHSELAGEAFNFSNGNPISSLELVKHILTQMDSNLEPEVLDQAENEILDQYLDAEKARRVLGWNPKFTLDEGIRRTIDWYRTFIQKAIE